MPCLDIVVSCPVYDSFRVQQVAGMFDVPLAERAAEEFSVELPAADEAWDVGLIVGPSGSGKSTVVRRFYANELYQGGSWPPDRAVVDCFAHTDVRKVIQLFTAVGFSSPPAWVKPFAALSSGEQFRCDLARALAEGAHNMSSDDAHLASDATHGEPSDAEPSCDEARAALRGVVAFDEFTSVVDRNVAQACSTAVAKGIRNGRIPRRLVAATCHYDVAEWLEADWVLDMATGTLHRRRLRRPTIEVQVHRCGLAPWRMFARHHYLSGLLPAASRCYLATLGGQPVSFCATTSIIAKRDHRRIARIVTLPDYQGMGIGMRVAAAVASLHKQEGLRINVTGSHPAVLRHCSRSPLWKAVGVKKTGSSSRRRSGLRDYRSSAGRAVASFEYVGP